MVGNRSITSKWNASVRSISRFFFDKRFAAHSCLALFWGETDFFPLASAGGVRRHLLVFFVAAVSGHVVRGGATSHRAFRPDRMLDRRPPETASSPSMTPRPAPCRTKQVFRDEQVIRQPRLAACLDERARRLNFGSTSRKLPMIQATPIASSSFVEGQTPRPAARRTASLKHSRRSVRLPGSCRAHSITKRFSAAKASILRLRLGNLGHRGFAVTAAPGSFPGHFLADPVTVHVVDDQTLHAIGSRYATISTGEYDNPDLRLRQAEERGYESTCRVTAGW